MILLAALRHGRISTCSSECWTAREPRCLCVCAGLCHGVGPEEASRRIASLDLATLAGAVIAMPALPLLSAQAAVVAPEPVRRVPVALRSGAARCVACGKPEPSIALEAKLDRGWLCGGCYDAVRALWRAS